MMELYKSPLGKKSLLSQDCLSAWGTIHWGPSLCKQQESMGCLLGSKVSAPATSITLSDSAHGCQFSAPISSPPINQWDHIKWNAELAIPVIKSFWAVLLQGAPDPECEPVTHHGWCTAGLLAPLPPAPHHIHPLPWPSCLNHRGFLSVLWTHHSTYLERSSRICTWLTPIHLFIPA